MMMTPKLRRCSMLIGLIVVFFSGTTIASQDSLGNSRSLLMKELHFAVTQDNKQPIFVGTGKDGQYYIQDFNSGSSYPSTIFSIRDTKHEYRFKTVIKDQRGQYTLYGYRTAQKRRTNRKEACYLKVGQGDQGILVPQLFFPGAPSNSTVISQVENAQGQTILIGNQGSNLLIGILNDSRDSLSELRIEPSIQAEVVKALYNKQQESIILIAQEAASPRTALFIRMQEEQVDTVVAFQNRIINDITPFDSKSYIITGQLQERGGDAYLMQIDYNGKILQSDSVFAADLDSINGYGEEAGQYILCRNGGSIFLSGYTSSYQAEARRPKSFYIKTSIPPPENKATLKLSAHSNIKGQELLILDEGRDIYQIVGSKQGIQVERREQLKKFGIFKDLYYQYYIDELYLGIHIINPGDANFGQVNFELTPAKESPYPYDLLEAPVSARADTNLSFSNKNIMDTLAVNYTPVAVRITATDHEVMKDDTLLYLPPLPKHEWNALQQSISQHYVAGKDSFLLMIKSAHTLAIDQCHIKVNEEAVAVRWHQERSRPSPGSKDTLSAALSFQGRQTPVFKIYEVYIPRNAFQSGSNSISSILRSEDVHLNNWTTDFEVEVPRPPRCRIISIGVPGHGLDFPPADAEAMAQVLQNHHGSSLASAPEISLLNSPRQTTYDAIRRYFWQLRSELEDSQADDITFLYLSAHGEVDQEGKLHFWASDYSIDQNPHYGVSLTSDIIKHFIPYQGKLILLIDACYSGQAIENLEDLTLQGSGISGLFSCRPRQESGEDEVELKQGIFTHHLIQAIKHLDPKAPRQLDEIYQKIWENTKSLHGIQEVRQLRNPSTSTSKIFRKNKP